MLAVVEPDEAIDKSVRWSVTDGTGSATIDPTTGLLTALTDGTVIVKATAKDASSTVGQIEITISNQVTTSLSNTSLANKFNVYPNPSVDEINIESQGLAIESISLIDIKGNIIKVVSTNEKINISDLPKGIYILKIQSGNDVINKRFVKE